jgi:hypothetical protein
VLLGSADRTAPARHRSLAAAVRGQLAGGWYPRPPLGMASKVQPPVGGARRTGLACMPASAGAPPRAGRLSPQSGPSGPPSRCRRLKWSSSP